MTAVLKEGRKSQEHHAVPGAFVCLFCLLWFCFVILYQSLVVHTGEGKLFLLDKALAYKRVKKKKKTVLRLVFFPVDVLIYWYADLETTSMLGSCLILIVYYSSTFFEAQKKKRRSCFFKL